MIPSKVDLSRMIKGALGEIKADLIVTGGTLVNVYSGEFLEGWEVAVIDGRICYVGPSAQHTCGADTQVIDAKGLYVAPGFVDGHTHIGHYARPYENLQSFLPCGTTTVVASCDELSTVFGYRGLQFFLDEVERHPLRVFTLVSMVAPQDPDLCNTAVFSDDEIAAALAEPRVLGMGEIVSWLRILQCDEEILRRIALARHNGQIIHGHTSGARDHKLCAIAATGISSCHEPIRVEDAIERLRLGYWTMLREGSLRQDLAATLGPLIESGVDLQRLILVTDSMSPDDVGERGHMDHVVRRGLDCGLAPMQAIRAVTLSPALCSGIDQDIGGIAPGRCADLVLIDDLARCHVREVLVAGKTVARGGVSLVAQTELAVPAQFIDSLQIGLTVDAGTFRIPMPMSNPKVRVMELINQTITAERQVAVAAPHGCAEASLYEDRLKIAMFDRHSGSAQIAFGFLTGFGAKLGGIGMTTNLDENTLMVVGANDADMALCANILLEAGGGIVIAEQGEIVEKLAFPAGGIFSLFRWQEVGNRMHGVQECLRNRGSVFDKPLFALNFLPFVTLPSLRITSRGLVNVKERKIVSLFVDEMI